MTPEGKREENGRGFGSRPFFVGGTPIRRRDDRLRLEEGARKRVTFGVPGHFAVRLPILIRKRYSVAADSAAPDRRATTPHIRLGIRTFPIRTDANAGRTKVPEPFIDGLTFREIENDRKGKGSFSRLSDRLDVFRSLLLVLWKRLRRARTSIFCVPLRSSAFRPQQLGMLRPSGRCGCSRSLWQRVTCSAIFLPFVSPIWPPFRTGRRPNGSCCRSVWRSRLRDSFSGESFAVLSLEKTESQSTARAWMSASYSAEPVDFLF